MHTHAPVHKEQRQHSWVLLHILNCNYIYYEMHTYHLKAWIPNHPHHPTHIRLSPFVTHKHHCKQTSTQMSHDKLKIPLLPLIMERMQKWPMKSSQLSVYKPLNPALAANERPVQSVRNPAPIWASLPWASFAFVLWLSEGQAPHAPA